MYGEFEKGQNDLTFKGKGFESWILPQFESEAFTETDRSKKTGFYVKICIKACQEIEKTQVVS